MAELYRQIDASRCKCTLDGTRDGSGIIRSLGLRSRYRSGDCIMHEIDAVFSIYRSASASESVSVWSPAVQPRRVLRAARLEKMVDAMFENPGGIRRIHHLLSVRTGIDETVWGSSFHIIQVEGFFSFWHMRWHFFKLIDVLKWDQLFTDMILSLYNRVGFGTTEWTI